jgi:hypothetical protein
MINRLLAMLLCLLGVMLLPVATLAEGCFLIDVDALDMNSVSKSAYVREHLSAPAQGVRVRKYISSSNELAARVRLTITQAETSAVVFDKSYGYLSGTFDSGDVYLPYVDNNTIPYIITLSIEDWVYAMPFMQQQPRLTGNGGCTYGLRLRELNPALTDTWAMGTMLDLDTLRVQGGLTLPVCASNQYIVGQASVSMDGDWLTVALALDPTAQIELTGSAVYVIGDSAALATVNPAAMAQSAYAVGQAIDVSGLRSVLLYVPLVLSYNPAGLTEFRYDAGDPWLSAQWALWNAGLQSEGGGTPAPEPAVPDGLDTAELPETATGNEQPAEPVWDPDSLIIP